MSYRKMVRDPNMYLLEIRNQKYHSMCYFMTDFVQCFPPIKEMPTKHGCREREVLWKEPRSMCYPSSPKKVLSVQETPINHCNSLVTIHEYEILADFSYNMSKLVSQYPMYYCLQKMEQWNVTLGTGRARQLIRADPRIRVTPRNRIKLEHVDYFQYTQMLRMMNAVCPIQTISSQQQWCIDLPPIRLRQTSSNERISNSLFLKVAMPRVRETSSKERVCNSTT